MAVKLIFVDGTLTTGDSNGTSWENAYQGAPGLQTAFDSVDNTAGTHNLVLLRNKFTLTGRIDFDAWRGSQYNNCWAQVIGCDSAGSGTNYTPLPAGQFVELDAAGVSGADALLFYTGGENISFENLWIHGVSSSGCAAIVGRGVANTSRYNYVFRNIRITDCFYAFRLGLGSVNERIYRFLFDNCLFSNITSHIVNSNCSAAGGVIRNSFVQIPAGCNFWNPIAYPNSYYDSLYIIENNIFIGGSWVFYNCRNGTAAGPTYIAGNSFYNQTEGVFKGCYIAGGSCLLNFCDNIVWLADSSKPILKTASSDNGGSVHYCNYNATNSTHAEKWAVNTFPGDNNIQLSNCPFVDPAGGNFNVNNPALLGGGMPDYAGNAGQIGAIVRKYQFPFSARTANPGRLSIFR